MTGGLFMKPAKALTLFFTLTLLIFTFACDGGGGDSSDTGGTGTLAVSLTDSAGSYKAVYITVESVEVHTGGNDNNKNNWETIPMDLDTINLCDLTNGVFEELGSISLTEGKYTQLRLHLNNMPEDGELNILSEMHPHANYVILEDNSIHELKVPSGFQSGVKIVKGFTINANGTTEIILDFDAMSSVVEAGNSGQWLLKPTIKVGELKEYSIIEGTVTNDSSAGIPNVYVSAQFFDSTAQDEKNKVVIQAGTLTDADGNYSLFVMPNTYNLIAYIDGKEFGKSRIETLEGQVLDNPVMTDFQLVTATNMETIDGEVSITGATDEQYATISYRQGITCDGCDPNEMIEIKSINVLNNVMNMDGYEIELPTGSYDRVASTFGYTTQSKDLEVISGSTIEDKIEFIE
jgi:hypothetical protein